MSETIPAQAKDLISKLLIINPDKRLGANDINELILHPFFSDIDTDFKPEYQLTKC